MIRVAYPEIFYVAHPPRPKTFQATRVLPRTILQIQQFHDRRTSPVLDVWQPSLLRSGLRRLLCGKLKFGMNELYASRREKHPTFSGKSTGIDGYNSEEEISDNSLLAIICQPRNNASESSREAVIHFQNCQSLVVSCLVPGHYLFSLEEGSHARTATWPNGIQHRHTTLEVTRFQSTYVLKALDQEGKELIVSTLVHGSITMTNERVLQLAFSGCVDSCDFVITLWSWVSINDGCKR
ncbi:unnamed protein product [Aspergillus oryzae]|uniref:Unnamed protein product n=2 Tax=Aspergillus oryzae TaxID=5062 RepID=A0AAN4YJJ1_ASPOZ|nr:unnamed protein product [Aspergillus oryzae]GMF87178.1 unnamed protein product [Aspergillus oryzae]GMG30533.1 unnamed protein product [Aspergillus oryzae]GMG45491.1 unnamed protein product [Aspergillus oryzae var. brunneus]